MKNGSLATKLMLAAILLAVLLYFGINLAAYFTNPFTTTVAYGYTSENAVTVSGYVVREEQVLPGEAGELAYFFRREGERVSAGGTVALLYSSTQSLSDANTLRSLTEQLEQLLHVRSLVAGTQAGLRLDEEVTSSLIGFRSALAAGSPSAVGESGDALRSAVLKFSYAYTGTAELDASIASLQDRISQLSAAADAHTTYITTPRSGLFSSLVDGYETVLLPQSLEELTPSALRAVAPAAGAGGVGKMIYGASWSFVTTMETGDLKKLAEGDQVTLRFQKGLDRDLRMTVSHIGQEEAGERVVVFTCDRYLNLTTLLRHQNAQVIFDSYTGIRVPRSAVRLVAQPVTEDGEPVLDSGGQPKTENVTGVYTVWGTTARFKPVTVLWQEEDYLLVLPAEGADAGRRLRTGDKVVTAAAELYDGKVIA